MTNTEKNQMNKAIALAEKCEPIADRIPRVGAVIAIGNTIIGRGYRGSGKAGDDDHAEMVAINKVDDKTQLPRATLSPHWNLAPRTCVPIPRIAVPS